MPEPILKFSGGAHRITGHFQRKLWCIIINLQSEVSKLICSLQYGKDGIIEGYFSSTPKLSTSSPVLPLLNLHEKDSIKRNLNNVT